MDQESLFLVDLIFNKFKKYKGRRIFLEKEDLKNLVLFLSKKELNS